MVFNQFETFGALDFNPALQICLYSFVSLAVTIHLLRTRRRSKVGGKDGSSHDEREQQRNWEEHPWLVAGYGKYKFHGLRERPLSDETLPVYQFGNYGDPRIKNPDLTPAEAKGIVELRESIRDIAAEGCRIDECTLQRFLRARQGDVKRAAKLARKAHALRMEHNVHTICDDVELKSYAELLRPWYHSGGFLGFSKEGEPVIFDRLGKPYGLFKAIPTELLLRLDMRFMTLGVAAAEEACVRRGTAFKQAVLVCDAKGLDSDVLNIGFLKKFRKIVQCRDTIEPELSKTVLIVRAPKFLAAAWNFVARHALTPETAAKVQIASSEASSLALLRKYISNDRIPAYLGGNFAIDGDPECRMLIAPGGTVPKEIIERLKEMIANSKDKGKAVVEPELEDIPTNEGFCCGCWGDRK